MALDRLPFSVECEVFISCPSFSVGCCERRVESGLTRCQQTVKRVFIMRLKVLVVSRPTYTTAAIIAAHAPSIPPTSITALIRLDLNRAVAQVYIQISSD